MKIGVFGGTFNPIHTAHMYLAKRFFDALALDRLILIPTFIPPHKPAGDLADAEHRLEMCRLAARGLDSFEVSDFEVRGKGKSYTFLTLEHLRGECPGADFFLLMGADMFLTVQDWKNPLDIFQNATLCAAARERDEHDALEEHARGLEAMGARCIVIDIAPMPLSSTEIREALARGGDVSASLDAGVLDYIKRNRLYGARL